MKKRYRKKFAEGRNWPEIGETIQLTRKVIAKDNGRKIILPKGTTGILVEIYDDESKAFVKFNHQFSLEVPLDSFE